MSFTDDDFERLKEAVAIIGETRETFCADFKVAALIARLEAAEAWAELQKTFRGLTQDDFDNSDGDGYVIQESMDDAEKAWRKAADK